jgi:hypothetical protein
MCYTERFNWLLFVERAANLRRYQTQYIAQGDFYKNLEKIKIALSLATTGFQSLFLICLDKKVCVQGTPTICCV